MSPVGLALHAFANEAGTLGVLDRPLVEAIDLELESVVVEVDQEVTLEDTRSLVGESPSAKLRMDCEPAQVRDPAALVRNVEAHDSCAAPLSSLLDLEHEAARLARLGQRALDLLEQTLALRTDGSEVRVDVVMRGELEHEVDVVCGRAPKTEPVACDRLAHGEAAGTAARRGKRSTPEPSAVPVRMSTSPTIAEAVIGSFSSSAP